MSGNETKHSQRASSGQAKAVRLQYVRPDTLIKGPDGKDLVLGRAKPQREDAVAAFHKFNPSRRDPRTGKPNFKAAAAARRKGLPPPGRLPFVHMVLTAVVAHRVFTFVLRRLFGKDKGRGPQAAGAGQASGSGRRSAAAAAAAAGGQLQPYGAVQDDGYDSEEEAQYEMDEQARAALAAMPGHVGLLPTMVRAALPKQRKRPSLPKRAAQQYHSRPRGYRTAHQMMHPGSGAPVAAAGAGADAAAVGGGGGGRRAPAQRPVGKLEKMDMLLRQQVRAAVLEQQRQQLLALQSGAAAPASGSRLMPLSGAAQPPLLPLPAAPLGHDAASSGALVPAGSNSSTAMHLPPLPPNVPASMLPPPPPFQTIPPELRARLMGAPRPSAVVCSAPGGMCRLPPGGVSTAAAAAVVPGVGAAQALCAGAMGVTAGAAGVLSSGSDGQDDQEAGRDQRALPAAAGLADALQGPGCGGQAGAGAGAGEEGQAAVRRVGRGVVRKAAQGAAASVPAVRPGMETA